MTRTFRLDLPLLLPGVNDERDACVARLTSLLEDRDGVERVHILVPGQSDEREAEGRGQTAAALIATDPQLCLHYDPERVSLSQVSALVHRAGAELRDVYGHDTIPFYAVGSEDDGRRIEDGLGILPGVTAASVNYAAQIARVEYDRRQVTRAAIVDRLRELGAAPTADVEKGVPVTEAVGEAPPPVGRIESALAWTARNRELVWSLLAGLATLAAVLTRHHRADAALVYVYYAAAYFFGARDNVGHFIKDLRRGQFHFNIDLLMVVAALGAATLGQWFEGALLLFLFSLGHALEHYALGRARNAIKALAELVPQTAIVRRDGVERALPIDQVKSGDLVVVRPGERVAVDGTVSEGRSSVNQAPITGESMPVSKAAGDQLFAGTVNGDGALVVSVTAALGDRTLDRVIKLVAEAQTQKAPTQQFTQRFERIFVPIVLAASVVVMVAPPLLGWWSWPVAVMRGLTMLVAASPCALALGTPAAVLAGIAQAARKGVLIKGGAHLEMLGSVTVVALDKTGTITRGQPAVTDLVPVNGVSEEELLRIGAAVERRSQHPLARAILASAERQELELADSADLEAVTGRGIRATLNGDQVLVGSLSLFENDDESDRPDDPQQSPGTAGVPDTIRESVSRLEAMGRTTVIVRRLSRVRESGLGIDGFLGVLGIADEPRQTARATLAELHKIGIARIVMLTGDNLNVARIVGQAVGVDDLRAGLLPEDKVAAVQELSRLGRVAMVGDGVNDAPALAHASVGIAMGGAGTAAALETADVALMSDDLTRLPFAIGLSRQARRVIRQNVIVSLGVIAFLVVTAVFGVVGMSLAVVLHEGSTLVVIANGLRLLAYGGSASS